ncbi:MAG: hypothetical protein IT537_30830, partial [Hyphomicrobiales bacterium]|nr:hypothetical protein [Hyphomicrobiales bacterium]
MKMIHEMRERQAWQEPKRTSPLPIVLGAVIAFGIGLLGVTGVVRAPNLFQAKTQMVPVAPRDVGPSEVTIDTSARRVGRAETAPLLKMCVPFSRLGFEHVDRVPPGDLYRILQTASGMSRVAAMAGIKQNAVDEAQFAAVWAEVADCIYRQNGWMLCDPDNRALAVEAASTLIRQLSTAAKIEKQADPREKKKPFALDGQDRSYALRNAEAIKGRVLAGLRLQ